MHSRYILQSIQIDKDESKLTDAISWLLKEYPQSFTLNYIDENEKHYIIIQRKLSKKYFPILKELINKEYGIYFQYYSNTMFPMPALVKDSH